MNQQEKTILAAYNDNKECPYIYNLIHPIQHTFDSIAEMLEQMAVIMIMDATRLDDETTYVSYISRGGDPNQPEVMIYKTINLGATHGNR